MVGCSAARCTNSTSKGSFTMLRFPKDPELRKKWTSACGRPSSWEPTSNSRLCDVHFDREQWAKFKVKLYDQQMPRNFCRCSFVENITNTSVLLDHSYAAPFQHLHHCLKMKAPRVPLSSHLENRTPAILAENCSLRKELQELTVKVMLQEKCEKATENLGKDSEKSCRAVYDTAAIRNGLKLRFSCGSSGYRSCAQVTGSQQPSIRTLQRRTQHISFDPGVQYVIMEGLKQKVLRLQDKREKDCCLFFDAMAIKQSLDFDIGTGSLLGRVSIPGVNVDQLACKAEVWMFGGVFRKWKQLVAWHLTPEQEHPFEKSVVIHELLKKGDDIGLNVIGIVCDMGNRGVLSQLGFSTKKANMRYWIPHPVKPDSKLWLIPDVVHVFKSLKEMICSNEILKLSDDIVKDFDLPSSEVNLAHVEWLEEYQRGEDLKFAPKLKFKDIHTPHYSKMKVKSSYQMLNHKVATALNFLAKEGVAPQAFKTTAWFVELLDRWRQIMTARCPVNALGRKNEEVYQKAIGVLKTVIRTFKSLKVRDGPWKPVQTHVIMATEAMLEIQEHLLGAGEYEFVLLGRFLQDIVENLFSVIRMQRPVPSPVEFKYRLKQCAISQFNTEIKNSSYDFADTDDFVDLLSVKLSNEATGQLEKKQVNVNDFSWIKNIPTGVFAVGQEEILYSICGYVVVSLQRQNVLNCKECVEKLRHTASTPHPKRGLVLEANYKDGALFEVSDEVFQVFRLVEYNLRQWKAAISKTSDCLKPLLDHVIIPSLSEKKFPTCHDVKNSLLSKFVWMRLKQFSQNLSTMLINPQKITSQLSSKTVGEKFLAENFKPKPQRKSSNSMKRLAKLP